jgi:hypothetical protein
MYKARESDSKTTLTLDEFMVYVRPYMEELAETKALLAETRIQLSICKLEMERYGEEITRITKSLESTTLILEMFQKGHVKTTKEMKDILERMKTIETQKTTC